jgi:hypothetical protein
MKGHYNSSEKIDKIHLGKFEKLGVEEGKKKWSNKK